MILLKAPLLAILVALSHGFDSNETIRISEITCDGRNQLLELGDDGIHYWRGYTPSILLWLQHVLPTFEWVEVTPLTYGNPDYNPKDYDVRPSIHTITDGIVDMQAGGHMMNHKRYQHVDFSTPTEFFEVRIFSSKITRIEPHVLVKIFDSLGLTFIIISPPLIAICYIACETYYSKTDESYSNSNVVLIAISFLAHLIRQPIPEQLIAHKGLPQRLWKHKSITFLSFHAGLHFRILLASLMLMSTATSYMYCSVVISKLTAVKGTVNSSSE